MIGLNLYVVKDMKSSFESQIYSFPNDEVCKRAIPYLKDSSELHKRYPSDFVVYRIGEFDVESGTISALPTPAFIADLSFGGADEDMA